MSKLMAFAVSAVLCGVAGATTTSPHLEDEGKAVRAVGRADRKPAPQAEGRAFRLTDQSEVFLDDKPCKFADIPRGSEVVELNIAADKITILRVRFRSPK